MKNKAFRNGVKRVFLRLMLFFALIITGSGALVYKLINPSFLRFDEEEPVAIAVEASNLEAVENGVHLATGFKADKGLQIVIRSCTPCHSAKLVTQNRANKEGWIGIIRWMQETQNLWDLGSDETVIVNYLAKNYAPEKKGRRENLKDIVWYELDN